MVTKIVQEYRDRIAALPRDQIIEMIRIQDPELVKGVNRIEWVFENKLRHLGINGRPLTNQELSIILDPPFVEDPALTSAGFTLAQQEQIHIASDAILWSKHFLGIKPRVYQILMIRDPSGRKVFRCGRRLGKTFSLAVILLHYAYTTTDGRCLVMAPMKSQAGLIFEEIMKMAKGGGPTIQNSIIRAVKSPQYEIQFTNGASIRLFTTGMKSSGKSDVARGQEAHIIVLDEMDYMAADDLDALLAMLQKTDENQPDKLLIAASTPSGRRERFYDWCTKSKTYKDFYFPSYVNPLWDREMEDEMHAEYPPMAYRHEIEADWGEDAEGVYPRKFVDKAFLDDWDYVARRTNPKSQYIIGVDWDKHAAGPNIVVLEICDPDHPDPRYAGKLRVAHREEIPRHEYVLMAAVQRVIDLNAFFDPVWIYIDRGYGDMQYEELKKYGVDHPQSGLKKKVKGIQFAQTIEVKDPATKQPIKKEIKPFMVENLRTLLETEEIILPQSDETLYMQLISYVVLRTTTTGRPVYAASGTQVDHAHDALILACLAYTQNYGELFKIACARRARSVSNDTFLNMFSISDKKDEARSDVEKAEEVWGDVNSAPLMKKRTGTGRRRRPGSTGSVSRKMF